MKRTMLILVAALTIASSAFAQQVKYVKYQAGNRTAWGTLENETTIREISAAVNGGARQ